MRETVFDPGREALDFIDDISSLTDRSAVFTRMSGAFATFGFQAWVVTGLPIFEGRMDDAMILNGWSTEWTDYYFKNDLIKNDPAAAYCLRTTSPFALKDVPYNPETWPAAKKVVDAAAEAGMTQGFVVPIHSAAGLSGAVSVGGAQVDLSPRAKRALHLMAIYAHDKAVSITERRDHPRQLLLTQRAREVLSWAAVGKTAWEISCILGVSQETVLTHLKVAAHKFETTNRVATVVAALRRGEISL